jgi:hypothetical protein
MSSIENATSIVVGQIIGTVLRSRYNSFYVGIHTPALSATATEKPI